MRMVLINSTDFMYETFQRCRLRLPDTGAYLQSLRGLLERVRLAGALDLTVDEAWPAEVFGALEVPMIASGILRRTDRAEVGPQNSKFFENDKFFELIEASARDLTQLWSQGAFNAVGNLGYALHNVPEYLRLGNFSRLGFEFCFRIAAYNWKELSADLQRALCRVMNIDVEKAERLIRLDGFAINNTRERPAPMSELKVVDRFMPGEW
jgi:hypothetical protein